LYPQKFDDENYFLLNKDLRNSEQMLKKRK
jgi:hypothetical protein